MRKPCSLMPRRALLQAGLGGLSLTGLLRARAAAQAADRESPSLGGLAPLRSCIFLFYYGGPSHIDTYDLKPCAPAEIRGEFQPIATSVPGLNICEHLPTMARVMHHVALVRSLHHGNRLHDSASIETLTGRLPPQGDQELFAPMAQVFPSFGGALSWVRRGRGLPLPHAALPHVFHNVVDVPCQGGGFLGPSFDPFTIRVDPQTRSYTAELLQSPEGVDIDRGAQRRELLDAVDRGLDLLPRAQAARATYQRAYALLDSPAVRAALAIDREDPKLRDRYGFDSAPASVGEGGGGGNGAELGLARQMRGQNLLLARRLVEAGVPFINVYDFKQQGQNWDAHFKCFNQHKRFLLPIADQSLSALIEDLESRGLLDSTLVVAVGEFGRTPRINRDGGRDHWPDCYTAVLAGGGVKGGFIHGASDRFGAYPVSDPVTPADLAATIYWRFGVDHRAEIHDAVGRPFPLAAGEPIRSLFL